jgi:IS30 family transposase
VTLVERKSGFALSTKVSNKTADLVDLAIEAKLMPLNLRMKTLTMDSGKEFADHQGIDQALDIQTYFADPYCSLQSGSNENFNGGQGIPKKRRMETVTEEELTMMEWRYIFGNSIE